MFQPHAEVPVFRAGYKWWEFGGHYELGFDIEAAEVNGLEVSPTSPEFFRAHPDLFRTYDPFKEEPALFRIFSDCETFPWAERCKQEYTAWHASTPQGVQSGTPRLRPRAQWDRIRASILDFVNQFGAPTEYFGGFYEKSFAAEVGLMRSAISLWEAVRAGDEAAMAQFVAYDKEEGGWYCRHTTGLSETRGEAPAHCYGGPHRKSDLSERARELLHIAITGKASEALQLVPAQVGSGLELRVEVPDLAYVFWLQFALAVVGQKDFARCGFCERPFEVSPEINRKSRKFCSDTCRVKHYYRRQAKARQLRAEGKTLHQIVKATGAKDTATVKKWVGEG